MADGQWDFEVENLPKVLGNEKYLDKYYSPFVSEGVLHICDVLGEDVENLSREKLKQLAEWLYELYLI